MAGMTSGYPSHLTSDMISHIAANAFVPLRNLPEDMPARIPANAARDVHTGPTQAFLPAA